MYLEAVYRLFTLSPSMSDLVLEDSMVTSSSRRRKFFIARRAQFPGTSCIFSRTAIPPPSPWL